MKQAGYRYWRLTRAVAVSLLVAGVSALFWLRQHRQDPQLEARLASIVRVTSEHRIDCAALARTKPLVLLALGQSNAGNHGSPVTTDAAPITLLIGKDCLLAEDPLPGATGKGGSIWRGLPALLSPMLDGRPVVLSVLAVDATRIADWTRTDSPLAQRLDAQIRSMVQLGLKPDLVLWQQGEADAQQNIGAADYLRELTKLSTLLDRAGTNAPLMLAQSTRCRSEPHQGVRQAVEQALLLNRGFRIGPDTDLLLDETDRSDGCHLNARGLKRAARAWAEKIGEQIAVITP